MKKWLPILIFFLGVGSSISFGKADEPQSPFFVHIQRVQAGQADPALVKFAAACGVKVTGVQAKLASNGGLGWKLVGTDKTEFGIADTDLVNTAEVWKVGNRFVVEIWSAVLDVGGLGRSLFCFDSDKSLTAEDEVNFQLPVEDNSKPWGMHELWTRGKNGKFDATIPLEYIDLNEATTPAPSLDVESKAYADSWGKQPPKMIKLTDLKIPSALLQ